MVIMLHIAHNAICLECFCLHGTGKGEGERDGEGGGTKGKGGRKVEGEKENYMDAETLKTHFFSSDSDNLSARFVQTDKSRSFFSQNTRVQIDYSARIICYLFRRWWRWWWWVSKTQARGKKGFINEISFFWLISD